MIDVVYARINRFIGDPFLNGITWVTFGYSNIILWEGK